MFVIADTAPDELLEKFRGSEIDLDSLDIILVEVELSAPEDGQPQDPQRGLDIAFQYAEQGKLVIILGEREYPELDIWASLFTKEKVIFCTKPLTRKCFALAVKKLMPEANI